MMMSSKRYNQSTTTSQLGLSLLEVILVMALVSITTMTVFMYYSSVQRNKKINATIQLVEQLIVIIDNYRHPMKITVTPDGVPTSTNDDSGYYTGLDANLVARSGLVPQQFVFQDEGETLGITTPWFGDTTIDIGPEGSGVYTITLNSIPNYACITLESRLKTLRDSNANCDDDTYESVTCDEDSNHTLTISSYPAGHLYCPQSSQSSQSIQEIDDET